MYDLQQLAGVTDFGLRELRYVRDNNLIPGYPIAHGHTRARRGPPSQLFTPDQCVLLCLAAQLLRAGLRKKAVRKVLAQAIPYIERQADNFTVRLVDDPNKWVELMIDAEHIYDPFRKDLA